MEPPESTHSEILRVHNEIVRAYNEDLNRRTPLTVRGAVNETGRWLGGWIAIIVAIAAILAVIAAISPFG